MHIELRGVSLVYEDKAPLFEDVDLELGSDDFLLIQGSSGAGKSSFLRLLNRLEEPTEGEIHVDGKPMHEHEVTVLRRQIGYVQQTPVMLEDTVEANLRLPFRFDAAQQGNSPSTEALQKWLGDFLLDGVKLSNEAQKLSVGQKQRVALIRTLLTQPEILLCDEPTSALDQRSREIVEDWIERLNSEQQIGVVLVTHQDFSPKKVNPRRFLLEDGKLAEVGG